MAKLSEKAVKAYAKIYLEEFGIELTEEDATRDATDFLITFRYVYRPLTEGGDENEKGKEKSALVSQSDSV